MERIIYLDKIEKRILDSQKGSIFIVSDFTDLAEYKTVKMCLARLEKSNIIRRILRGIYEYPEYNDFLGEYVAASPDKIAKALARNFGWTIAPGGDTALNFLGLSTQVPATWVYVSDGPYKKYKYENVIIEFKHRTNRETSGISYKTALVIQAFKTLGEKNVNNEVISKVSGILNYKEKENMLNEAQNVTAWIYEIIKKICRG